MQEEWAGVGLDSRMQISEDECRVLAISSKDRRKIQRNNMWKSIQEVVGLPETMVKRKGLRRRSVTCKGETSKVNTEAFLSGREEDDGTLVAGCRKITPIIEDQGMVVID